MSLLQKKKNTQKKPTKTGNKSSRDPGQPGGFALFQPAGRSKCKTSLPKKMTKDLHVWFLLKSHQSENLQYQCKQGSQSTAEWPSAKVKARGIYNERENGYWKTSDSALTKVPPLCLCPPHSKENRDKNSWNFQKKDGEDSIVVVLLAQSCLTLCGPMDCSPSGFSALAQGSS